MKDENVLRRAEDRLRFHEVEIYYLFRISTFGFRLFHLSHRLQRSHQLNDSGLFIHGIQPKNETLR